MGVAVTRSARRRHDHGGRKWETMPKDEHVSGVYEVDRDPGALSPPPRTPKRRVPLAAVVAAVVVALGLCGLVAVVVRPLVGKGASAAGEWRTRLAKDYPRWRQVSFDVRSFSGSGGSTTTYTFGLVPPDRDFSVGVLYESVDGQPPVAKDEVLRPDGAFNDRAESLLDLIESTYVERGDQVASVVSDASGVVTVSWLKVRRFGPFSSRFGSFDEVVFEEATDSWRVQ